MTESRKIEQLEAQLRKYEENGVAKLYYSLNRKANEMAEVLNANDLKTLDIDDPKSKAFERLKVIWTGASEIAAEHIIEFKKKTKDGKYTSEYYNKLKDLENIYNELRYIADDLGGI